MSFIRHTSCEACGSSDACAVYEDNTYCHACHDWNKLKPEEEDTLTETPPPKKQVDISYIKEMEINGFRERKVTKQVAEFFDVKSMKNADGEVTQHYYPYTKEGSTDIIAYKQRTVEGKKFKTLGDFKGVELFGQSKCTAGGRKIVMCEGEMDAWSIAQAHLERYGTIYPVVSLPNGAGSVTSVLDNREFLRSFDEVILMMDMDAPGQEAIPKVARVIGSDKVKIASLSQKDPSDTLLAEGQRGITGAVWDAQRWCPAGVINSADTWDQYIAENDAIYTEYPPFVGGLNRKIFGRRMGSITTFTSGTGSGKTSFLREDMFHLLKTTDSKIGVCSLEESVPETVRGFISLELNQRVGIPGCTATEEDQRRAWESTMGSGRFEILDHQGSVDDNSLLDKMEYLACTCDYIYLDHITIAISGDEGGANEAMDNFMSSLLKMAKRHNVWIGLVSHLRKSGQEQTSFECGAEINEDSMKGSGSLKQISAQIIAFERNKSAETQLERSTVSVRVLKDRFGGDTGLADKYVFSFANGRLSNADQQATTSDFDNLTKREKDAKE